MKVSVLGIKIDDVNMAQALEIVEKWIGEGGKPRSVNTSRGKHYIVTPNPEFLVTAQTDCRFKEILNNADLSIPDGWWLKLSGRVKNTTSGIELMENIIHLSATKGFTVAFLGGREGIANRLAKCLKRQHQNISVTFAGSGGEVSGEGCLKSGQQIIIPTTDFLFVAFGHGKQEKWIENNLTKMPVKVMMGVGGSFDELSGILPRCPAMIQGAGFKWLFRLIFEPWRIKRQLSLVKYFWLLFLERFRPNDNLIDSN